MNRTELIYPESKLFPPSLEVWLSLLLGNNFAGDLCYIRTQWGTQAVKYSSWLEPETRNTRPTVSSPIM
jgi:hypothetical protein